MPLINGTVCKASMPRLAIMLSMPSRAQLSLHS